MLGPAPRPRRHCDQPRDLSSRVTSQPLEEGWAAPQPGQGSQRPLTLPDISNPKEGGQEVAEKQGHGRHPRGRSPADLALGPACMALSSWSMGWLDREKIQISATLAEASLMLLQRLSTWPPSGGRCITWGRAPCQEGPWSRGPMGKRTSVDTGATWGGQAPSAATKDSSWLERRVRSPTAQGP